jgi:hypothetical protein
MSRGSSGANDKDVYKLPEDVTEEVIDTPDIIKARAFNPRAEFDVLNRTLGARLSDERQAAYDDYGAYTGIPSATSRARLRDQRIGDANTATSLAIAEGAQAANEAEGNYLMNLAQLTAKKRRSGFTSAIKGQQGGGIGSSLIGAGGAIASAAIIA